MKNYEKNLVLFVPKCIIMSTTNVRLEAVHFVHFHMMGGVVGGIHESEIASVVWDFLIN